MNALFSAVASFGFGTPGWLLLLAGLPLLWRRRARPAPVPAVSFPSVRLLTGLAQPVPARPARGAAWLRVLAVALVILALARPRLERAADEDKSHGIDIMLVLDASRSMDTKDFDAGDHKVSRREALEQVIASFLKERTRDRLGIVGFAEKPFLISPLTLDHSWMLEALHNVQTSLGTAIGSGVEAAVDLLRQADAGNRVAIVVTDGLNTSGNDPLESARTARRFGVRLYTVGVVSYAEMKSGGIDNLMLSQMARLTGGQFFQAADQAGLRAIYGQIDQLERREFRQTRLRAYRELFPWCAALALALVAGEAAQAFGRREVLP